MSQVPDFSTPLGPQDPHPPTAPLPAHGATQPLPVAPPAPQSPWQQPVPGVQHAPPVVGQVVPYQQPPYPVPLVAVVQAPGTKDTLVAYLLWFFLGGVGADRFYVGRTGEGVTMLCLWGLGVLTVWFFVGWLFLATIGIWSLVNAFRIPGDVRLANARALQLLHRGYR